tara:strand:- start:2963 stop:4726 length:1764 start_codon:yes stop_codon:yes gene_type:complete
MKESLFNLSQLSNYVFNQLPFKMGIIKRMKKYLILGLTLFLVYGCVQDKSKETSLVIVEKHGTAQLTVVLGTKPSAAERRVTELLAERIKDRTGLVLSRSDKNTEYHLVLGTVATNEKIKTFAAKHRDIETLGADGYYISVDPSESELYVIGQSESGVVAGVGKLMREMRYKQGKLEVPALQISETPQMPNRGMYLWARRYYFDNPDQLDRYIEELALWGCNGVSFWFEMAMFNSFQDTTGNQGESGDWYNHYFKEGKKYLPQEWITKYQRFYNTARRMGMKTGLLMVANDAYMSSPKEMRIEPIIGAPGWAMCPSKPGSVEQMLDWQEEVFRALSPIDIFNIFPADPGGCSCDECTPWPTNGLWKIALPLGDRIHEISPGTEIWIDTWHLNHPTFGGKDWQNLVDSLDSSKETPKWFAGFEVGMAPHHKFAGMSAEERNYYNNAKRPITVFPDISMWGNHEGMLVNKEYWKSLQSEINDYDPKLMKGGWPYTERWNTDIANIVFLSWFKNSKKSVDTILDEYASFYFGPEAETGRKLLDLLDDENKDSQQKQKIRETLAKLESTVPAWVKNDWRWNEIVLSCSRFM